MLQKYSSLGMNILILVLVMGCNATRHLQKDEYLLKSAVTVKSDGKIRKNLLNNAITLKPNRRLLIPKTYLHLYNFGQTLQKDSSVVKRWMLTSSRVKDFYDRTNKWLTTGIGEEPVLINKQDIISDSLNLFNVYFSQGYFYPEIEYEIDTIHNWFEQQKANLTFEVQAQKPARIQQVKYILRDSKAQMDTASWAEFLAAYDTTSSLLQKKRLPPIYQHKLLEQERLRATAALKDAGYFTFTQSMISFLVDTTTSASTTQRAYNPLTVFVEVLELPPVYTIDHIQVNVRSSKDSPDLLDVFTQRYRADELSPQDRELYRLPQRKLADTVNITFVATHTVARELNYNFIARRIYLKEGEVFDQKKARLTQQRLLELGMFQIASINYNPQDSTGKLEVIVNLQTALRYQLKIGTETFTDFDFTTSSNLPVLGVSLGLSNKNAFKRSELLEFNIGGSLGLYASVEDENNFDNIFYEIGGNVKLNIPQFLLPIGQKRNLALEPLSPQTVLTGTISRESRREFRRLLTGLTLSYRWQHIRPNPEKIIASQLTPIGIDFIDIIIRNADFQQRVDTLPIAIQRDYQARFSSRTSYSFTYSNYGRSRAYPTNYFQVNAEVGGNLPYLLDRFVLNDSEPGDNQINDNLFYGQYVKGSFEYKRYIPLNRGTELVLRGLIGAAKAYRTTGEDTTGNIYRHVPFENRFFSGGANSMRGWRSNTLGPGTLRLPEFQNVFGIASASSLLAPGGEVILELNAELRFDVISYLELAIFTDAGNVWFNQEIDQGLDTRTDTDQSTLTIDNLQLGWDAGIGFRFDFSFLILRLDIGQQLYAPDKGWILQQFPRDLGAGRAQYNLGIGYPF